MDPATVVGVVASIATLIGTAKNVYERIMDIQRLSRKLPRFLQDAAVLLPLVLDTVNNYKTSLEALVSETASGRTSSSATTPGPNATTLSQTTRH
jgi:hypothetical protein